MIKDILLGGLYITTFDSGRLREARSLEGYAAYLCFHPIKGCNMVTRVAKEVENKRCGSISRGEEYWLEIYEEDAIVSVWWKWRDKEGGIFRASDIMVEESCFFYCNDPLHKEEIDSIYDRIEAPDTVTILSGNENRNRNNCRNKRR